MTESKAIAVTQERNFIDIIDMAIKSQDVDIVKLQALLDMQERIMKHEREASFNRDYLAAKLEMPRVTKDGAVEYAEDKNKPNGPKVKAFNFATYENIDKVIRPIEQKYGFTRIFTTKQRGDAGGGCIVHCQLLHKDGHFKEAEIGVALDTSGGKNNIQAMGSSFSYGKRYTTEMLWDIVKEGADNDGNYDMLPIDDAQFAEISKLIKDSDTDVTRFCSHLKIESLRAMTNKLYPKAVQDLKSKIAKMGVINA